MSVVRFNESGNIRAGSGIKKATVTLTIKWKLTNILSFNYVLSALSLSADSRDVSWNRFAGGGPDPIEDSVTRSFKVSASPDSGNIYQVSYSGGGGGTPSTSASPTSSGDSRLVFDNGNDRAVITLSYVVDEYYTSTAPPTPDTPATGDTPQDNTYYNDVTCPTPVPWESLLPTCGSAPTGLNSTDGLQISKTGKDQITLNLKNYANKLVTLKITHQTSADWTQSFDFNIPNCSDISPNTGGTPYSKSGYSNGNISGTNTFYVYNIDGGDYDYIFNHSSIPGPRPTRTNYRKECTTTTSTNETGGTDTTTTCVCISYTETYAGTWPHCPTGVAVSKNGGDKVQWQYEDGGGGNYDDQYVTVEVVSVRNAIGASGPICTSSLKNNVWITDNNDLSANGNCISDYKDHSDKIRFRIPSLKQSKTTLPIPLCYSEFRGIAGAAAPGDDLGSASSEYSVLHTYDRDFFSTLSLVTTNSITVQAFNDDDTYVSPYNESDPSSNTNLGTLDRKYYTVTFNDGTEVSPNATNISIAVGQSITAGGLNVTPTVFKKEQVNTNTLRVWFYINYQETISDTEDIIHIFDDTANTDGELSKLITSDVTVTSLEKTDPGVSDPAYETLNASNKKHYRIVFSDSTIVEADGSNIDIILNQNKTAAGVTASIGVSKKQKVDDKTLDVWFTAYYTDRPAGQELDNAFARDWSISREKVENFSGNVFPRSWYLNK